MSTKIRKFSEINIGQQFFAKFGKDWDCHLKVGCENAQRITALLGVEIGTPFFMRPDKLVKVVD